MGAKRRGKKKKKRRINWKLIKEMEGEKQKRQ